MSDSGFANHPFTYPHPALAHWVRRMTLNLILDIGLNLHPGCIRTADCGSD
jgi:hypothetical protein